MGKGWRNTSEVMVASFGMWGAAWVRGKNEGKRRGRLPDTYVNESECTDLKIRFEKEFVLTRAQETLLPSTKEIPSVGKRGKTCEHRKQKSHGAHTNGKSTG